MTVVNDMPLTFDGNSAGGKVWQPKNYDGQFEGPMSMRTALKKSKNMVSIRVLQAVGTQNAQDWVTRFGFDADKHPPYLTMALGAGSVTPMQMVAAYAVFANGGLRVNPYLITRVTDQKGQVLVELPAPVPNETQRAIEPRNAFVMSSLLQEITRSGTAARAQAQLKRPDLFGKTGTTNDAIDTWFVGFQPTLAAGVWMGYDKPRKLGDRETGGGLSLPVWIGFMEHALKSVPVTELPVPPGVLNLGGEWYYEEFARGNGVTSLGVDGRGTDGAGLAAGSGPLPPPEERRNILDLFRQ